MNQVVSVNSAYEKILHSNMSQKEKSSRFATLMTEMERRFNIPLIRNVEYEKSKKTIIALYRKISMSRSI